MKIRRWSAFVLGAVGITAIGWLCLPKPPLLEGVSFSRKVFSRDHELLRMTLTGDDKYRIYTPLDRISPELIQAALLHEDRFYRCHFGINPVATARATLNFLRGHGRSGASTITMQLARMRFKIHSRTVPGKLLQMARALEIERHYSKREILEAYFNLAPYGGNIEGVGAASEIYFGRTPSELTRPEAVALSVIPQSPARRALQADRRFLAPHFTAQVLAGQGTAPEMTTTLDLELQRILERRISGYVASKRELGITNAAAMLVDFRSMDVLAEVGSANFLNKEISGQIDGTRSKRSPGSTLKPFVYALAMDQGLIHPLSILKDAPRSFGAYNPENFDREFAGPIRAEDALARSRNIPAIDLASRLSHPTLYEFLKTAGVDLPRDEKCYGLALPLGGAEVTMQDLVRLYSVLGNDGKLRPLHYTLPHIEEPGVRLLSPEASFLTLEMLGRITHPSLGGEDADNEVFWKTGTSNGFRDAWSASVFDHYVLVVWVGNFDGSGNPAFVGRTCAGPLLFQMIDAMRAAGYVRARPHEPPPGANLKRVEFCAVSGKLATPACEHRVSGWFIPGISPITTCDIHREVLVDVETGLRVPVDDGTRKLRRQVCEFWPSDLLDLFQKAGLARQLPPPFLPGCRVENNARLGKAPAISSPKSGVIYSIRENDDASRGLCLRADAEADVRKIYWFADKAFLGSAAARETLNWHPTPGAHKIVALDDYGRSDSCTVTVQSSDVN